MDRIAFTHLISLDPTIASFTLMSDCDDADYVLGLRVLVEGDVSALAVRNHEFPQRRPRADRSPDLGMLFEDKYRASDPLDVLERGLGITFEIEIEDPFEVDECFLVKENHAILRALGRAGASPLARRDR